MKRSLLTVAVPLVLLLAACGKDVLPVGPQELEGKLERVPLSLSRRGTHLMRDHTGEPVAYAESTAVNLGSLQNETVTLLGVYEPNTDRRALPVFVVQKIVKGGENTLKLWELPFYSASISVPVLWEGGVVGTVASFREPATQTSILEVTTGSAATLPFNFQTFSASSGSTLKVMPIVIGLRRAATILDEEAGTWTVYVDVSTSPSALQKRVLVLTFSLVDEGDADEQITRFQRFVRTLKINEKPKPPAPPSATGSGAVVGEGQPCGGTAGILCPAGFYCQITDQSISSGVCRKR